MKRAAVPSVFLAFAACAPAIAAESKPDEPSDLTIDLASPPSVLARSPGVYRIHLINRIPRARYPVSTRIVTNKVAQPFDTAGLQTKSVVGAATDLCATAKDTLKAELDAVTTEQQVAALRLTYADRLKAAPCSEEQVQGFGQQLLAMTEWRDVAALPALDASDTLFVTVIREATSDGLGAQALGTWQFDFGKREAQWLTFYGFNFADSGDENYFSEANAGSDPATYTITKAADRSDNTFSPSIYFFRLPAETGFTGSRWWGWRNEDTFGGVTAGLGFDFDNPTVFLGYGVGWGYNLMLTAGVVMHKEKRLNGQYNENDVISENLTSDQLLDSTYKPRAYIGLAFRFGSNPFSAGGGDAAGAEKKEGDQPK